ncbi:MAG: hypothetical protein SFX72_19730 [Isosphaeraceae bacterium]|nr:hypothetical protein [Isosphaeraceae bacterium]
MMGLFEKLFASMSGKQDSTDRARILEHWGIDESEVAEGSTGSSDYDRSNWRRKLGRILDRLPASESEWADFLADAHALGFEPEWITQACREEFALLVRRAVADHVVTDAEHRKLDIAQILLEIPEAEAERIFESVVAEAEAFFGKRIRSS